MIFMRKHLKHMQQICRIQLENLHGQEDMVLLMKLEQALQLLER